MSALYLSPNIQLGPNWQQSTCIIPQPKHPARAKLAAINICQFGPSWMFWLEMELMAYAGLVGGTTEQSFIFPYLI